jgi:multisubunit Na+/H+ antiporter MnhB subunit
VILQVVALRMLGPALMFAAAIIVKGYTDVGDGFSAGVVVALAISLRYIVLGPDRAEQDMPILRRAPMAAAAGLLIALASGFYPILRGDPPFTHSPGRGDAVVKIGSLELITAVLFDIGVFLLVTAVLVILVHNLSRLVQGSNP